MGSVSFLRHGVKTITPGEKPLGVIWLKKGLYIRVGQVVFGFRQFSFLASYLSLPHRRSYGFVTQSSLSHKRGTGTRDNPLRMTAWEAIATWATFFYVISNKFPLVIAINYCCKWDRVVRRIKENDHTRWI